MVAGDVVLKMTLRTLEEGEAFAGFLTRFLDGCGEAMDLLTAPVEAPFVMVTSEPVGDSDLRTVTFQEADLAASFAAGWDRVSGGCRALRTL